jgi:uncharacterized metal-binding protein YceD (DUF177 family)
MKVDFHSIEESKPLEVLIEGGEKWLAEVYSFFSSPKKEVKPRLTADLKFSKTANIVRMTGSLQYSPFLRCSRCAQEIRWPISKGINCEYFIEDSGQVRSMNRDSELGSEEYLTAGGFLDLARVCNEAIVLSIPSRTLCGEVQESASAGCCEEMADNQVYPPKNCN